MRDPGERVGLASAEPSQFGDREGGNRNASTGIDPAHRAQPVDESLCIHGRLRVVPQLGRTEHLAPTVENHEAVLLGSHGHRTHVGRFRVPAHRSEGPRHRLDQRRPPGARDLFAAGRHRDRVVGTAGAHHLSGGDVAELDLCRLRGRVDPGDERHARYATGRFADPRPSPSVARRLHSPTHGDGEQLRCYG